MFTAVQMNPHKVSVEEVPGPNQLNCVIKQ